MADCLDDGEFWLPPQFLTDDDDDHISFGRAGIPLEFGTFAGISDFSSTGETESDEEDLVAGLTLRMSRSAIDDGFDPDSAKGRVLAGSPQSTLCGMGSGSGCSQGSSRGSPKGNCKVPSPPATWDLLHAAAGEVAKMRINEIPQVSVPVKNSGAGIGFYQQLQAMQFQRYQQMEIMHRQNMNSRAGYQQQQIHQMVHHGMRSNQGLSSSSWLPPPPPPPQRAGIRALVLGTPAGKRECAGTGVFLPRHTGTQSEQRKKPGCSTVLVPAKVMQALNLQHVGAGRFHSENDVLLKLQMNHGPSSQKRNIRRQAPTDHEIKLPQEWTY